MDNSPTRQAGSAYHPPATDGPPTEGFAVDFWGDPSCPYTLRTAGWLREVTRVRPVLVRWQVMSLAVLNEGLDVNPEDPEGRYDPAELTAYLMAPVRLAAAVIARHGHAAYGELLAAHTVHTLPLADDEWVSPETLLAAAGLPTELAAECWTDTYDGAVRAAHAEAVALAGAGVGSPVIALPGPTGEQVGFFGPVISEEPRGETAGRLWDGVAALAGVPGFYELKRSR